VAKASINSPTTLNIPTNEKPSVSTPQLSSLTQLVDSKRLDQLIQTHANDFINHPRIVFNLMFTRHCIENVLTTALRMKPLWFFTNIIMLLLPKEDAGGGRGGR
jgi:hypothetical protein